MAFNDQPCFRQLIYSESIYLLGRHVDEYEFEYEISRGSYGAVYRARNNRTGEAVAIKMEFHGLSRSTLMEIHILKSLPRHPCIVGFNEVIVDECGGGVFVVMEHLDMDLRRFMRFKKRDLTVGDVKLLMKKILEGVNFLHKNGVMHRDLKPSNVLVNEKGELRICDFGLSCYSSQEEQRSCGVGTRWYKAPELFFGHTNYSSAVDMWSVGCIMGELILNEVLFKGKNNLHQVQCIFQLVGAPFLNLLRLKFEVATINYGATFLTNSGYDLLERLLSVDPSNRITAQEALNHKWFREYYGLAST